ncbi:MAG: hypothetical protein JSR46_00120 [Verrucomicrobia bacterium]|nr:hypothetical protein [Verrucomicrobiota bacterium]
MYWKIFFASLALSLPLIFGHTEEHIPQSYREGDIPISYHYLAPDGSEIRLLTEVRKRESRKIVDSAETHESFSRMCLVL